MRRRWDDITSSVRDDDDWNAKTRTRARARNARRSAFCRAASLPRAPVARCFTHRNTHPHARHAKMRARARVRAKTLRRTPVKRKRNNASEMQKVRVCARATARNACTMSRRITIGH